MKTRISTFSYSRHSTVPTTILCFVSTLVCFTKSRNKLSKRKKKKEKIGGELVMQDNFARNVSLWTLYGGQFTLSTQLRILNYPDKLFQRCSTSFFRNLPPQLKNQSYSLFSNPPSFTSFALPFPHRSFPLPLPPPSPCYPSPPKNKITIKGRIHLYLNFSLQCSIGCNCNSIGASDNLCNAQTGQCTCRIKAGGRQCNLCPPRNWGFPLCRPCRCNGHDTSNCHPKTGECLDCQHNTAGKNCEVCATGYYGDATKGKFKVCIWVGSWQSRFQNSWSLEIEVE